MPDFLQNFAGLAIAGSIIAFYNQIKSGVSKVFSILIRRDRVLNDYIGRLAFNEILNNSKIIRWGNSDYTGSDYDDYIKSYGFCSRFFYKKESSLFLIYKKIPIFCKILNEGLQVTYLYKTFNFTGILERAVKESVREKREDEKRNDHLHFYTVDKDGQSIVGNNPPSNQKDWGGSQLANQAVVESNVHFNPYWVKNHGIYFDIKFDDIGYPTGSFVEKSSYYWSKEALKLREEVSFFINNTKWFHDKKIPHRRGTLLTGFAGTGKSKMVLEVAKYCDVPLIRMNIANMSDQEFKDMYSTDGSKYAIILIEDIDSIMEGRTNLLAKNSHSKNLLSFDTLINTISGTKETNGIFLIISSNHPEKLDVALKRAGRLDVKIEVGNLDEEGRKFIANNILGDLDIDINEIVVQGEGKTVADYEALCVEKAIEYFYKKKS